MSDVNPMMSSDPYAMGVASGMGGASMMSSQSYPGGAMAGGMGMSPGGGGYPSPRPSSKSSLSTVQMKLLSAQIKAYRYLSRNMVIPDQLRAFIMSHAANVSGRSTPTPHQGDVPTSSSPSLRSPPLISKQAMPKSSDATNQNEEKSEDGKGGKSDSGQPLGKGQAQLKQVKLTPLNKPAGIDPESIVIERETRWV